MSFAPAVEILPSPEWILQDAGAAAPAPAAIDPDVSIVGLGASS